LGVLINNFFNISFDVWGFLLILICYVVGSFSIMVLEKVFFEKNNLDIFLIFFISLVINIYSYTNNLMVFFLAYEAMLIPSFFLVYFCSSYKRNVQAAQYFLIWTQAGSFLVLVGVVIVFNLSGSSLLFDIKLFMFSYDEAWYVYFLIFFGFGFKVPVWPFHYWITKTHVEAPAGFSIFLSGFLVKTAVYGFYKISNLISTEIDTIFFLLFPILGLVDSSMKMWGQLDIKKLIAYGTIQEMNLIYLIFVLGDSFNCLGGFILCVTHALLSSLMFFLVDCVQIRYNSRLVTDVNGIMTVYPNLGLSILIMIVFYSGLPGTIKFLSEFYIFSNLFELFPLTFLIVIISSNFFGLIGFSKCWFNIIFGLKLNKHIKYTTDLNFKEVFIIFICLIYMLLLTNVCNIFI